MPQDTRLIVVNTCAVARIRLTRRPPTRSSFPRHATELTTGTFYFDCSPRSLFMIDYDGSDTPLSLMLAAMQAIPEVTETLETGFNFSLFTGDLTSHDTDNQYSR